MQNINYVSKLKMFGRFPKTNFSFNSQVFIDEYNNIISSDTLFENLLSRMIVRYGKNEPEKAEILEFVKNLKNFNLNEDKFREIINCDKNIITAIGQEMDTSIRLFAQKNLYKKQGKNEFMIDEFGFSPKTFNYLINRGYNTKNDVTHALRNGYISNQKVKDEIKEAFSIGNIYASDLGKIF